jgi:hypothetical protein
MEFQGVPAASDRGGAGGGGRRRVVAQAKLAGSVDEEISD